MGKRKRPTAPDCECGCCAKTRGGRFVPGHDAKLKKTLIAGALRGSKRAANKLEKLGWSKFLAAKRAVKAEKGRCIATAQSRKNNCGKNGGKTSSKSIRISGAAEAARAFAPTLDPPLDETTARIMGFGAPLPPQC